MRSPTPMYFTGMPSSEWMGNGDAAFCSAVQLSQNNTCNVCHFRKLSGLCQCILACGAV